MRDYAIITPQFWIGQTGKAIKKAGIDAQVVALYLLSSPHANMLGLYHLPVAYIAADIGCPLEGASKGLRSLIEAGFCEYDDEAEVVWVHEMAKFQIGESLKADDKRCSGVQNQYNGIPENRFLSAFFEKYEHAFNLKNKRETEAPPKPLASPFEAPPKPRAVNRISEQEQEQEHKTVPEPAPLPVTISAAVAAGPEAVVPDDVIQEACKATWGAYSTAYESRYGTKPVRNATVNSQVKQFVKRIGARESPAVAGWFPAHPGVFYVQKCHAFGVLLADAEKVRTEWATGVAMTNTRARQSDKTGAIAGVIGEILNDRRVA